MKSITKVKDKHIYDISEDEKMLIARLRLMNEEEKKDFLKTAYSILEAEK